MGRSSTEGFKMAHVQQGTGFLIYFIGIFSISLVLCVENHDQVNEDILKVMNEIKAEMKDLKIHVKGQESRMITNDKAVHMLTQQSQQMKTILEEIKGHGEENRKKLGK